MGATSQREETACVRAKGGADKQGRLVSERKRERRAAGEGSGADRWGLPVSERKGRGPGAKWRRAGIKVGGPQRFSTLFLLFKSRNSNKSE